MKIIFTIIAALLFISPGHGQDNAQFTKNHPGIHKVVVTDVLQTTSYTYLRVKENDKSQWIVVPKIEAKPGEVYYYQGGNEMTDFKSTQLNRTFKSVLFLGGVVKEKSLAKEKADSLASKVKSNKKIEVTINPAEGGITIAELFSNKSKYAGKIVKIKGKVTQFSSSIMGKNWIHLQDGTEYQGIYDLVATSNMDVKVGEIVVLEGKIALDKDFGFGYFYKVIMEDSKVIQ